MAEIKNPEKRTFWKATSADGKIVHEGYTDIDQVTTTGLPNFQNATLATTLFPALPTSGTIEAGKIYSYNGGMVICVQTHERTVYSPEETPALFNVYRANTDNMTWVANEKVIKGDKRTYNNKIYVCLQDHVTQVDYTPTATLNVLWKEYVPPDVIPVWVQPTGAHDAYNKGAKVHYPTINDPVYESLIDNNVWSPDAYPAGWKKL